MQCCKADPFLLDLLHIQNIRVPESLRGTRKKLDRKRLLVALNGFSPQVGRKGAIGKLMGVSVSEILPELLQISGRQLILNEKLFSINMPR
jgi:hypothetical protein